MCEVFSWRVLKPQVFPPLPVGDAPALPRSLRQAERGFFFINASNTESHF
jgi:hypothetical protein